MASSTQLTHHSPYFVAELPSPPYPPKSPPYPASIYPTYYELEPSSSVQPPSIQRSSFGHQYHPHFELPDTPDIVGSPVLPALQSSGKSEEQVIHSSEQPLHTTDETELQAEGASSDGHKDVACCPTNPCIGAILVVTLVLLLLLGMANSLFRAAGEEYRDGSLGFESQRPPVHSRSAQDTTKRSTTCTSDICLWEGQYLDDNVNYSADPCDDFYSHVCSANWFAEGASPYMSRASQAVMNDLWEYLRSQPDNASSKSFVHHAAVLARGCMRGPHKDKEWAAFRSIFSDLGIPRWPYHSDEPDAEAHDIAKVADKFLGTSTFVTLLLRERPSDRELELHLDSPPIFLRRYEAMFPDGHSNTYGDFVYKVLAKWRTPSHLTHDLAHEIVQLEEMMSQAAAYSSRSVPIVHVTRPVVKFKALRNWDWFIYLSYFIQEVTPSLAVSNVVLLDPKYMDKLSIILTKVHRRTLINYIGYRVVIYMSPLLPVNKVGFMVPLSHQYNVGRSGRLEACMFLLERICPFGVRTLAWSAVNRKAEPFIQDEGGVVRKTLQDLVRYEMKRCALTAPWLTLNESRVAALKMERMDIELTPQTEDTFFLPTVPEAGQLLMSYYKLFRFMRTQYWAARHLMHFPEPTTPTESAFLPGFSYDPQRNLITLSPATFAFAAAITRRFEATSVPFLITPLVRGMFSAIDFRGSSVDSNGVSRNWWSSASKGKFLTRAWCIQSAFVQGAKVYAKDNFDNSLFLEENVADGAVLRPLHSIFLKFTHREEEGNIPGQMPGLTRDKLFFINYASTFCEPAHDAVYIRNQFRYKTLAPASLRVNGPLKRFDKFSEAFGCASGSPMNPKHSCTFW
ncbi:neprilysin-2-like [Ornithodoros turicata]|uniref:neprilysin-2-like n=1 Tax=Ornithodoros turicata TaxID=34597 RepID=UPI00313A02A5